MRPTLSFGLVLALLVLAAAALTAPVPRPALNGDRTQQWGTVKGRVVWSGGAVPDNPVVRAAGIPAALLVNGPIREDRLVVHPQNKGVRWVLVWLADPTDATQVTFVPPIHPGRMKIPPTVVIDQPGFAFLPRVMGMQTRQDLVVKNSSAMARNFKIQSIGKGPAANLLIAPGGQATVRGFFPKLVPTPYSCALHPAMKGYVGTFTHPYFAVTDANGNFEIKDAPAGKFQLMVWHEEVGFVLMKNRRIRGKVIGVKPSAVTDLGKINLTLPKDD